MKVLIFFLLITLSSFAHAQSVEAHRIGETSPVLIERSSFVPLGVDIRIVNFLDAIDDHLKSKRDLVARCTIDFFWRRSESFSVSSDNSISFVGHGKLDIDVCGEKFKGISCDGLKCKKRSENGKIADFLTIDSVTVTVSSKLRIDKDLVYLEVYIEDVNDLGDYLEDRLDTGRINVISISDYLPAMANFAVRNIDLLKKDGNDLIFVIDFIK
jgi:hypothetical protein